MINILLKCDDEFHRRMKEDKFSLQAKLKTEITWEEYIKLLFGMARR